MDRRVAVLGSVAEVPVGGTAHERAAAIAAQQRGYVRRAQLLGAGVSSSTISRMAHRGALIPVHCGVFAVGHLAPVPYATETAALLAVRDGAALSHSTAADLWDYPETGGSRLAPGSAIEITLAGSNGACPRTARLHRSRILAPADIRIREGLPVTSPERTLLDLATALSSRGLERDLDHALRRTSLTERSLRRLLERAGAHHGRARLAHMLDVRTTPTFTRSEAEELLLALVRAAGLAQPLVNVRRHGYELDFLWARAGVAVEVDGFAFHGGREAFERDRRKDADLLARGIVVVRVTWRQLTDDSLATITRIAQLLAVRGG